MNANVSLEPVTPRWDRRDIALMGVLLLVGAVLLSRGISDGGFRHGDSAAHAMDGVLIHDWIAAGVDSWLQPMAFAVDQYAHYPTLGIGRHYPPGFAVVEAAFFAMFGVSEVTARLCVVFFGLVSIAGAYTFVRLIADRTSATLAGVALLSMPATLRWGRQVMLEVPTLAVMIWTGVALVWYLQKPTARRLLPVAAGCLITILFKQTGLFLAPAFAITVLIAWRSGRVSRGHAVAASLVAGVAVAAVWFSLDRHGATLLRGDRTFEHWWSLASLSFYPRATPYQVGPLIAVAALIGFALYVRRNRLPAVFLIAWMAGCYAMLSIADYKNLRYVYVGLFPLAVFAGVGSGCVLRMIRRPAVRFATASAMFAVCVLAGSTQSIDTRPDYGKVVLAQRDNLVGRVVLFSGVRDGDFVFAVRRHLPWRSVAVVRGSKLLYTCNGRPNIDFQSNVASREALADVMKRFAFRTVVVERENKLRLEEDRWLRDYLVQSGCYRNTTSTAFRMEDEPCYRDITVDVFELTESLVRSVDHVDIMIPRSGRLIRLDLSGWS